MRAAATIICITGFREGPADATGLGRIWLGARKHSSPETWVTKFRWNADWKAEARDIARNLAEDAKVVVCAYSWGAGFGFIQLAKHLRNEGVKVTAACLCDPVYRSRWLVFRWLALVRLPRIKLPFGVGLVRWVRQRVNRPAGHDLVAREGTVLETAQELNLGHGESDESRALREMCERTMQEDVEDD